MPYSQVLSFDGQAIASVPGKSGLIQMIEARATATVHPQMAKPMHALAECQGHVEQLPGFRGHGKYGIR